MTRKNWSSIWIFVDTKLFNSEMVLNFSTCKGCDILMFLLYPTLCICCSPNNKYSALAIILPLQNFRIFLVSIYLKNRYPFFFLLEVAFQSKHVQVNLELPYGQQSHCLRLNIGTAQLFCNLCQSLFNILSNRKLLQYLKTNGATWS